jgi:hypothetical protein
LLKNEIDINPRCEKIYVDIMVGRDRRRRVVSNWRLNVSTRGAASDKFGKLLLPVAVERS